MLYFSTILTAAIAITFLLTLWMLGREEIIEAKRLKEALSKLDQLATHYSQDGNWNYDPSLCGVANGLRLALATMTGQPIKHIDPPDVWLRDLLPSSQTVNTHPDQRA